MRRTGRTKPGVLVILLLLLAGPRVGAAAPDAVTTEEAALRIARAVVTDVVASGRSDLADRGALAQASLEEWYPVHHPETRQPVYGLVPVRGERGHLLAVVAVDATAERWLWYRFVSGEGEFPAVSAQRALERASARAGALRSAAPTGTPILIEGADKHLYWHVAAATGESWLVDMDRPDAPVLTSVDRSADKALRIDVALLEQQRVPRPADAVVPPRGEGLRSDTKTLPSAYRMPGVPYHYQITSWYCGPASLQMVMDHWGQEIGQDPISDVANDIVNSGCITSDMDRAAHFSGMSAAIQDPALIGYADRKLGYASTTHSWGSDPDRYDVLRTLACAHYPFFVLTWYSTSHSAGHYRVVVGYDDNLDVFIMHDPWYSGGYSGPDLLVNQTIFVDDLWRDWSWCWGMVSSPWFLEPDVPATIAVGDTFDIDLTVRYPAPLPELASQDLATGCVATIALPAGLSLTGGTATQALANLASGGSAAVSWEVVANGGAGDFGVSFQAQGVMSGTAHSYPSYSDSIGGHGYEVVTVESVRAAEWGDEIRLTNDPASSQTCRPGGRALAIDEYGTAHLVWADTRDGNSEIYYQSRMGEVWAPAERITNDPGYSTSPSVACDEVGNVHVAWVENPTGDLNHRIYYKWLGTGGWSAEEEVARPSGSSAVDFWPSIAAGGDEVYLAWEGHPGSGTYNHFVVWFSTRADTGWTAPANVDGDLWKSSFRPSLAWGADDLLHIVYEHDAATMEEQKIRHRTWDGVTWSGFTAICTNVAYSRGPVIAAGADSTLHVVWQDGENGGGDIFYATHDGTAWQAAEQIVIGTAEVSTPSVAVDLAGDVHVVWENHEHDGSEIYLKTASGGIWGDEFRISAAPGASGLPCVAAGAAPLPTFPARSFDEGGQICVVWTDLRDGNAEIYSRTKYPPATAAPTVPTVTRVTGPVSLSRPYPLPFVSETRFTFSLAQPGNVALAVYDLAGRRVKTLVSGHRASGTHAARWDGRNADGSQVSPGVYFVRCATRHGQDVRRLVLLR